MNQVIAQIFGLDGVIILLVDLAVVAGVIALVVYLVPRP
jgi:hypothetical protein